MSILTNSNKGQAWYMDFGIAMLLFTFTIAVYFGYTNNVQKQDKGELDLVLNDAKSISNSLALEGYPDDWSNSSVVRIGIADEQQLNATKLKSLKQLNYTLSKRRFSTAYDYFVYFVNEKGEVLNVMGVCSAGYPLINLTYSIKSAYYYQDPADSFLKSFMNSAFKADIYFDDKSNDIYGLHGLISNLSKYQLVAMEHPLISGGDYNEYYRELNNYTASGGFFLISGELTTSNGKDLNGVEFWKKSGQSESQRTAIVNNTDSYLNLNAGDTMVFNQYYYVTNDTVLPIEQDPNDDDYNPYPAVSFLRIATFNQTDDKAIAKWKYGNGTVYFFSDFDVSAFNGNFTKVVEEAVSGLVEGTCSNVNTTNSISPKNLAKIERYLIYNSKPIKMRVYAWR